MSSDKPADIARLFESMVTLIDESGLNILDKRAVLCKLLILISMSELDKKDFMQHVSYAWDFEKFFRPDSNEIH